MSLRLKNRYRIPVPARPHHTLPQRVSKKEQRSRAVHWTTTAGLVLVLISIGAGMAYTWYNGQNRTAQALQAAPVYKPRAEIKPHKAASDAKVGVATQTYIQEVKRGENASITIRTNPEASCAISVLYNNVPAVDSGLVTKTADEFGVASWGWTIAPTAPLGKWPVEVMCKNKKHSAMVRVDVTIK